MKKVMNFIKDLFLQFAEIIQKNTFTKMVGVSLIISVMALLGVELYARYDPAFLLEVPSECSVELPGTKKMIKDGDFQTFLFVSVDCYGVKEKRYFPFDGDLMKVEMFPFEGVGKVSLVSAYHNISGIIGIMLIISLIFTMAILLFSSPSEDE